MSKFFFIIACALLLLPSNVLAATTTTSTGVNLVNPLGTSDVRVIIGTIIKAALGLSGSIALTVHLGWISLVDFQRKC